MDQSLLLSDEMHLLKIRNFDKLQSKLKNIPLTDTKNTAGSGITFWLALFGWLTRLPSYF